MKIQKLVFVIFIALVSSCSKERRSDKAAEKMQQFVKDISNYAKGIDNDFFIIPQNGIELTFEYTDIDEGVDEGYMNAIDGVGVEELFYNGSLEVDNERLEMLDVVKSSLKIMVADFVTDDANVNDAFERNYEHGFISFPRSSKNYDYKDVPSFVYNENSDDIHELTDAKNYLYLISNTKFNSKQAMIDTLKKTNYDVLLIDLFFDETAFSKQEIESLKVKANGASRLVISYINVGAAENWRYYWENDWKLHKPRWLKKEYDGYDDEIWVKFWHNDWQEIIYGNDNSYIKKIIDAGFDGAYLDNVEAYYFLYND